MIKIFSILILNNLLILINFKKLSKIINIFDKPDKNLKKHKSNVPLLGGIIIVINLISLFIFSIFFEIPFENFLKFININKLLRNNIENISIILRIFFYENITITQS